MNFVSRILEKWGLGRDWTCLSSQYSYVDHLDLRGFRPAWATWKDPVLFVERRKKNVIGISFEGEKKKKHMAKKKCY